MDEDTRSRDEHLAWCKARALEILDAGDHKEAWISMFSDLRKHPELKDHCGLEFGLMLAANGFLDSALEVRQYIEGFN